MKRFYMFFFSSLLIFNLYSQLDADYNGLRVGDVIVKQQIKYKDPGEAAAHVVWDFSKLDPVNDAYTLTYSEPPLIGDSVYVMGYSEFDKKIAKSVDLIVAVEHNTMYYLYQSSDSLLLLGHENTAIKQENVLPVTQLLFPLHYGQNVTSRYQARGLYSGVTSVFAEGGINIYADAFGSMILPSGDTLSPVLRVKTEQTIFETAKNVINEIENDKGRLFKSYKWYAKNYRYPIFETVESIDLNNGVTLFSTAFFCPPQEDYYINADPILDKLWAFTQDDSDSIPGAALYVNEKMKSLNRQQDLGQDDSDNFSDGSRFENTENLNVRVYPSPVSDILHVEYTLSQGSPVTIAMYAMDGRVMRNIYKEQQQAGEQYEEIDCSNLVSGSYLLKVVAEKQIVDIKVLKK